MKGHSKRRSHSSSGKHLLLTHWVSIPRLTLSESSLYGWGSCGSERLSGSAQGHTAQKPWDSQPGLESRGFRPGGSLVSSPAAARTRRLLALSACLFVPSSSLNPLSLAAWNLTLYRLPQGTPCVSWSAGHHWLSLFLHREGAGSLWVVLSAPDSPTLPRKVSTTWRAHSPGEGAGGGWPEPRAVGHPG